MASAWMAHDSAEYPPESTIATGRNREGQAPQGTAKDRHLSAVPARPPRLRILHQKSDRLGKGASDGKHVFTLRAARSSTGARKRTDANSSVVGSGSSR